MTYRTRIKYTSEQKAKYQTNQAYLGKREKWRSLGDILEVLKIPKVWLIAIVILASYTCYWGGFYFAKFATDAFAMGIPLKIT